MHESWKDKLWRWLWRWAEKRPYFHLYDYMGRWWLLGGSYKDDRPYHERGWQRGCLDSLIGRVLSARLHRTLKSDDGRVMHDHPSWSISIVLAGGYWEVLPVHQSQGPSLDDICIRRVWRGPGAVVFRRSGSRHRLEIPQGHNSSTSIFIRGRTSNQWGFYTPRGKVFWKEYLGIETNEPEADHEHT